MIFAPASITCIFSPEISSSARMSGSIGVGFTIDLGVFVEIDSEVSGVVVNDREVDFPTVDFVLQRLGLSGVRINSELPFGCGFGLSGASALATALSVEKPFMELADLAHEAEVRNLTGLGDVVTQTFGGLVIRKNAACPSKSIVERYKWDVTLDLLVLDQISTKDFLADELRRNNLKKLGKKWTKEFLIKPTIENLFRCSNNFAKETGLLEYVEDIIEAVESEGGSASMVMLGKAVFASGGFKALEEFGDPFKASMDYCGVRKI